MYTLRRIAGSGTEFHFALGKSYTYVDETKAPDDFNRMAVEVYGTTGEGEPKTYAFVTDEGGQNIYPLYEGQAAFIMHENGKTFANVSCFHRERKESGEVAMTLPKIIGWLKDYELPDIFEALKANVKIKRHHAFLQDCIDHFTPTHESEVTLRNG